MGMKYCKKLQTRASFKHITKEILLRTMGGAWNTIALYENTPRVSSKLPLRFLISFLGLLFFELHRSCL